MAGKAGIALVEIKFNPGDLERMMAEAKLAGKKIADDASTDGKKISKAWAGADKGLIDFGKAADNVDKKLSGTGPFGLGGTIGSIAKGVLNFGGGVQTAVAALGKMSTESGRSLRGLHDLKSGFTDASKGIEGFAADTTRAAGVVDDITKTIERLAVNGFAKLSDVGAKLGGVLTTLGGTLSSLAPLGGIVASGFVALGAALLVLPALVGAATFVFVALLDVVTTLSAVLVSLAGPLLVVTGLLGGLGAAFAYVATQSFANKASLQDQHDALLKLHVAQQTYSADVAKYTKSSTQAENALIALHKAQDDYAKAQQGVALGALNLDDKFHNLVQTLSKDFQPQILKLASAASQALTYLSRIAKLPLKQAFQSLATQGVALLSKFVYGVATVLKNPFKFAIQIAFGAGGTGLNSQIASWWNSLSNYLFGYTTKHKIVLDGHVISMTSKNVKGALDPLLKFLGDQHFVKTGIRWANEIISGLQGNKDFLRAVDQISSHAGHVAAKAFTAALQWEIGQVFSHGAIDAAMSRLIQNLFHELTGFAQRGSVAINDALSHAFDWLTHLNAKSIDGAIGGIAHSIISKLGGAWQAVKKAAESAWHDITSIFSGGGGKGASINWLAVLNLGRLKSAAVGAIGTLLNVIVRPFKQAFQLSLALLRGEFRLAFAAIEATGRATFGSLWGTVKRLAFGTISGIQTAFSRAFAAIGSVAHRVIGGMFNGATAAATAAGNAIQKNIDGAWGAVKHAASSAWDYIKSLFSNVLTLHINIPTPSVPHVTIPGTGITLPHTGGLVLPGGGLAFAGGGIARGGIPGRDSIPAMLTPGEVVLNESQQMALLRGGIQGDTTVQVFIDGKEIQSAVSKVQRRTARAVQAGSRWG